VAFARGFEEARREAMREAWSVGFWVCWLRVRGQVVKARVALVLAAAIDGRRAVFCGWRCRRWRRVCWRRERTQELQTVELDMLTLFVGFCCIGVVSVVLERECSSCL
jgi:hypothetical protein